MKPRLLVIELHHLGDAILSIPFLQAARESYEVSVYCAPQVADMLSSFVPEVEIAIAQPKWAGRFFQAVGELRALRPEVTVCAWSDARADLLARLTGAPRRIGFPMTEVNYYASQRAWRKRRLRIGQFIEKTAGIFGCELLSTPLYRKTALDSHLRNWELIAANLGLELNLNPPWFSVPDTTLPGELLSFLQEQQAKGRPVWVIHPGGRLTTKRWPLPRFQALLQNFFAPRGWPVVIINALGEGRLEPAGNLQKNVICETHLRLAGTLSFADTVLCNDSYPAHLAAALGKRVFSIFGSGEPAWFSPFQNSDRVIQTDICPHHPCVDRCVMPSVVCLEAVTENQVEHMLERPAKS